MDRFVGIIGIVLILGIAYAFSNNRKAISLKTIIPSGIACGVCFKNASGQKYVPRNWDVYPEDS